jgi:hypothetical protein
VGRTDLVPPYFFRPGESPGSGYSLKLFSAVGGASEAADAFSRELVGNGGTNAENVNKLLLAS